MRFLVKIFLRVSIFFVVTPSWATMPASQEERICSADMMVSGTAVFAEAPKCEPQEYNVYCFYGEIRGIKIDVIVNKIISTVDLPNNRIKSTLVVGSKFSATMDKSLIILPRKVIAERADIYHSLEDASYDEIMYKNSDIKDYFLNREFIFAISEIEGREGITAHELYPLDFESTMKDIIKSTKRSYCSKLVK